MGLSELMAQDSPTGAANGPELGSDTAPAPAKPAAKAAEPDEGEEELGLEEEGKVPVRVVGKMRAEKRALKEAVAKAEARIKEIEGQYGGKTKLLEELYGKFEKPEDQLREDATVAEALWALREDPVIKQALAKIQQHHQGARVTERAEKPAEAAPAADPRVEQLMTERLKDRVTDTLKEHRVKKELHSVLTDYVLRQNPNPTKEAVFTTMNEYIVANNWTREFVQEKPPSKQRTPPLPNPGGLNAGTPVEKGKEAAKPADAPKSLSAYQAESRRMLHEKLGQRGVER